MEYLYEHINLGNVLLVAVITLLWLFHLTSKHRFKKDYPPGPNGLPFLGVLPFLTSRPDKKILEWSMKYGDVMSLPFADNSIVVLSSLSSIIEGPVRQGLNFANRPWSFFHDRVLKRNGIAMLDYSEEWLEQRRFTMSTLKTFGLGKTSLTNQVVEEVEYFAEGMRKVNGDFKKGRVLILEMNGNIIARLAFGRRFDITEKGFMSFFAQMTESYADASFPLQLSVFVPWTHHFHPFRKPLRDCEKLHEMMQDQVTEEIKRHKETFDPASESRDFIDEYLKKILELKDCDEKHLYTEKMLMFIIRDFFVAGVETIASTITWAILILANRPNVQKQLVKEISEVVGSKTVDKNYRQKMPYTQAFLTEVMRYRTVLPLGVPRVTTKDTRLGKYMIPKGTTVVENLYGVHNHPSNWDKPYEFIPERHLEDGKFVKNPNIIPFGLGARYCMGQKLAEINCFIIVVSILQRFHVEHDDLMQYEDVKELGLVQIVPEEANVKLTER